MPSPKDVLKERARKIFEDQMYGHLVGAIIDWTSDDSRCQELLALEGTAFKSALSVICARIGKGPAPTPTPTPTPHDNVIEGIDPKSLIEYVSPVYDGDEQIGTVARIGTHQKEYGLFINAAHVFSRDGKFVQATAFGQPLELLASFPYHDVVFLKGPKGKFFRTPDGSAVQSGTKVAAVNITAEGPTLTAGVVALVSGLAAVDYHNAMPNSNGGAVLKVWRDQGEVKFEYVGTHVGTMYYLGTNDEELPKKPKPPIA
eukprot:EG_transcript_25191